jgi:hypothetical protein
MKEDGRVCRRGGRKGGREKRRNKMKFTEDGII